MEPGRKIIHVDMDAFYAAVEQRDFPEYRGRPIVVGGPPDSRSVVCTASYEARRFGVKSAMPCARAARLCPDAVFVRPRFEAYAEVSRQIRAIFLDYTDLVEPLSLDEAYLDVTLNRPGISSATRIAEEIRRRIRGETGLTASAGVSSTKFVAKVASDMRKPDGLTVVPPDRVQAFVESLPVGRFFGVGKVTEQRMLALGIATGADLRARGEEELVRLFGRSGAFYHRLAWGIDPRPVVPERRRKSVGVEDTFERDIADPREMRARLRAIAERLAGRLRRAREQGARGRTIVLKVKFSDFRQVTRSRTVGDAPGEPGDLHAIACELLDAIEAAPRAVRLLGISVSLAEPAGAGEACGALDGAEDIQLSLPL